MPVKRSINIEIKKINIYVNLINFNIDNNDKFFIIGTIQFISGLILWKN